MIPLNASNILPDEAISSKIFQLRGQKVIMDKDLASLFDVPAERFNVQFRNHIQRLPVPFVFQMTKAEKEELLAQCDHLHEHKYSPCLPYVFTEHGVIMLATMLNSEKAISASTRIAETFINMREMMQVIDELVHKLEKVQ